MLPKLKVLGYTEVTWAADSLWGAAGQSRTRTRVPLFRDHRRRRPGRRLAAGLQVRRRGAEPAGEGFAKGNVLAGYVHLHWASRPEAIDHFLSRCKERS